MNELNVEFIEERGKKIRNSFYRDFLNKDYIHFKYDAEFSHVFHEFGKTYYGKCNVYIPGKVDSN